MAEVKLGRRLVGAGHAPLIIAEMSGNHNHSLDRALLIVEEAAKAGAHALKLQTYKADTMTLDVNTREFVINDPKSQWNGYNLHKLYEEAATPYEWHEPIFKRCRELGLEGFSTPFDPTAVDFLESLDVPFYKIASFEITDLPLIERVAKTGKPMILSCGMSSVGEIDEAVRTARGAGCKDVILLKCTSTYPSTPSNSNILTIPNMRELFQCEIGISDHTMGIGVSVAAVALGATVIEKHFTLKRSDGGVDSTFSMEPAELRALAVETERAWQALGSVFYGVTKEEKASLQFRRSVYISRDVREGELLTEQNLKIVRPGFGLSPKFFKLVLGRPIRKSASKGTPLSWDMV